jgi:membrane-bound inhibitor of C-type lysozyme
MKSIKLFAVSITVLCGSAAFADASSFQYSCNNGDMTVRFTEAGSQLHGLVSIHNQGVVNHFRRVLGNDFNDYYNGIGVWTSGADVFCTENENSCSITGSRSNARLTRQGEGYVFEIKTEYATANWFFESCRLLD